VLQCKTGQYNSVEYNTIEYINTHHTNKIITYNNQDNPPYAKLQKKKKIEKTLYTIETQKRAEPKIDESLNVTHQLMH
jgi:hypothetical protein